MQYTNNEINDIPTTRGCTEIDKGAGIVEEIVFFIQLYQLE
jgi:hypothetical protein